MAALVAGCAEPSGGGDREAAARIARAYSDSGLEEIVGAVADATLAAAETAAQEMPAAEALRLQSAARAAIEEPALDDLARERFEAAARGHPGAVREAVAFWSSPAGQSIRAAEQAARAPGADAAFDRYLDASFSEPVDVDRVKRLLELGEWLRAAELAAEIEASASRAVAAGAAALGSGQSTGDRADAIARQRDTDVARLRAQSNVLLPFVYAEASDSDLSAYLAWLRSPSGRFMTDSTFDTLAALGPAVSRRLVDALESDH